MEFFRSLLRCRGRLPQLTLTLLLAGSFLMALLCSSPVLALEDQKASSSAPNALPLLSNTPEKDLEMSIEVSDQYTWSKQQQPVLAAAAKPPPDVWDVILAANRIPMHLKPPVEKFKAEMTENSWWIEKILVRAKPFLAYIVSRLDARGLPLDLALIPVIESGYQPHVVSSGSAVGLWQIVPVTAKQIGLKSSKWFEARADLQQSTRAALDYLSYLNAEFEGNWELTLAAYNAGPGRVKSAMARNDRAGKPVDYWSLDLPRETENYVPKFIALVELLRQTPDSPFKLPLISSEDYFVEVDADQRISLDQAARLSGVSERALQILNAALIHDVTPPDGPHMLYIPSSAVDKFKQALKTSRTKILFSLPLTHEVKSGDNIGSIALTYGLTRQEVRELNGLSGDLIKIGQKLHVRDKRTGRSGNKKPKKPSTSISSSTTSEKDALEYIIQPGDTLSGIAQRFNVRVKSITLANGTMPNEKRLIPGQRLLIKGKSS